MHICLYGRISIYMAAARRNYCSHAVMLSSWGQACEARRGLEPDEVGHRGLPQASGKVPRGSKYCENLPIVTNIMVS